MCWLSHMFPSHWLPSLHYLALFGWLRIPAESSSWGILCDGPRHLGRETKERLLLLYEEMIHQNRRIPSTVLIPVSFSCVPLTLLPFSTRQKNETEKRFANISQDHFEIEFSIKIITLLQTTIHLRQELNFWFRGWVETIKESLKSPRLNVIAL